MRALGAARRLPDAACQDGATTSATGESAMIGEFGRHGIVFDASQ
jgi:hypothetical protein